MAYLIGTDEAGYGPFLGPLVITATGWECPHARIDLYKLLADSVTSSPKDLTRYPLANRVLIADSKVVNQSGKLERLERTVMVLLKVVFGRTPKTLADLVSMVTPEQGTDALFNHFWLQQSHVKLPMNQTEDWEVEAERQAQCFGETCLNHQVKLNRIESAIIQPPEFNASVAHFGNKASLLSHRTLSLVDQLLSSQSLKDSSAPVQVLPGHQLPSHHCDCDVLIDCDKHGGRNYYAPVVAKTLTDNAVETLAQSPQQSVYRFDRKGRRAEIRFTAKGESQMTIALASMVSKYLREAFMKAWNDYWQDLIPEIKSTKGYPQDAKRFLIEISTVANSKSIFRNEFWRNC